MNRLIAVRGFGAAILFCALGQTAMAGDLNPPVGPVAPTLKTLFEVEPRTAISAENTPGNATALYRITRPGSYYLTDNVVVTGLGTMNAIEIHASDVTLDLNGFAILPSEVSFPLNGIEIFGVLESIVIKNGTIRGCGEDAIHADFVQRAVRVEGIHAVNNGQDGISVSGYQCVAFDCSATGNGLRGFNFGGFETIIERCFAGDNGGTGFSTGDATMANCRAENCGGSGFDVPGDFSATNCSAENCDLDGFFMGAGGVLRDCVAESCGDDGFDVIDCIVDSCTANDCGTGIEGRGGISGGIISNCSIGTCENEGILVTSTYVIKDNLLKFNTTDIVGANIRATGSSNRIEGNTCIGAENGIRVEFSGNIIICNSVHGASGLDFDIVAGNAVGDILNVVGATITTTNPWRNFVY